IPICRRWLTQTIRFALLFAEESAGNSRAARIAMMAMTTSNSIKVKDGSSFGFAFIIVLFVSEFSNEFWRTLGFQFRNPLSPQARREISGATPRDKSVASHWSWLRR